MILDIITIVASVGACLFAFLSWYNQVQTRLIVKADLMVFNNSAFFQFPSLETGNICIFNAGYKAVTVIDVILKLKDKSLSLNSLRSSHDKICITINPGEVKNFTYSRDIVFDFAYDLKFDNNPCITWVVVTADNRHFKCKMRNRFSDIIDVRKSNG